SGGLKDTCETHETIAARQQSPLRDVKMYIPFENMRSVLRLIFASIVYALSAKQHKRPHNHENRSPSLASASRRVPSHVLPRQERPHSQGQELTPVTTIGRYAVTPPGSPVTPLVRLGRARRQTGPGAAKVLRPWP